MNIPDEAVEAASAVVPAGASVDKDDLVAILKAAAPHIMAQAWDEGAEADAAVACEYPCGSCDGCNGPELVNPYKREVSK